MQRKDKIYGIHSISEALENAVSLDKVFIQKDIHNPRVREMIPQLKEKEIPFQFVPKEKLHHLAGQNHQGIVALRSLVEYIRVEQLLPGLFEQGIVPLLTVLCSITDVRNFGAIARSAECFGVHGIIVPGQGSAPVNGDAMQASAGALHTMPICREANFLEAIRYIQNSGVALIACTEKTDRLLQNHDLTLPTAIILGAEGEGIPLDILSLAAPACIPLQGKIESLNVSVAAGIAFYETQRQRRPAF